MLRIVVCQDTRLADFRANSFDGMNWYELSYWSYTRLDYVHIIRLS